MSIINNIEYVPDIPKIEDEIVNGKFIITLEENHLKYGINYEMYINTIEESNFLIFLNNQKLKETEIEFIKLLKFIKIKSLTKSITKKLYNTYLKQNPFERMFGDIYYENNKTFFECFEIHLSNSNIIHILCINKHNGYYPNTITYFKGNNIDKFTI